jgi:hypothetical protein
LSYDGQSFYLIAFYYIPEKFSVLQTDFMFFVRYFQKGLREIFSLTRRLIKSVFGKPNTFLAIAIINYCNIVFRQVFSDFSLKTVRISVCA